MLCGYINIVFAYIYIGEIERVRDYRHIKAQTLTIKFGLISLAYDQYMTL